MRFHIPDTAMEFLVRKPTQMYTRYITTFTDTYRMNMFSF